MISPIWGIAMGLLTCVPMLMAAAAPAGPTGTLRIVITNTRGTTGQVHVDLCRQPEFLKDCPIKGDARAVLGATVVSIPNVPVGRYAAQVFYDENGNGRVDRGLFGVPKEGVGFSRDARIAFGPPKWTDAVFDFTGSDQSITLKLRYFTGGDALRR